MKEITIKELADIIGGTVVGDGSKVISGVSSLDMATGKDVSFFTDPKLKDHLKKTNAGVVICNNEDIPFDGTKIITSNPYLAFTKAVYYFHAPPKVEKTRIHHTALIGEGVELVEPVEIGAYVVLENGVKIGKGTRIDHCSVIKEGVVIGEECKIHPNVTIYKNTIIGNRVEIHAGAVLGSDGFGYARDGSRFVKFLQIGKLVIEDDVEIGANTTIDRAALGETRIKRGVKLDNLIHIAHNCIIGEDSGFAAQVGVSGSTKIGARCMVGGQVGFAGHLEIGDDTIVFAKAGVHTNLKSGESYVGIPAGPAKEVFKSMALSNKLSDFFQRLRKLERKIEELTSEK